ncbi:MAG: hypothetical protein QGI21_00580 [Candidatus Poseidoniaceae archaeon]|jgi:hypothetical protein|nr:hypothetical protein [Candidatus Poseidoniaceae archaeon]
MPIQIPPEAQSIGRARGRLSASSLTTFNRCNKQWFLNYRIGLRGPLSPHQVLGVHVEDGLCSLFMERAPYVDSQSELRDWIMGKTANKAIEVFEQGKSEFENALWSKGSWDETFTIEMIESMLINGLELQLEEVESCHKAGGGINEFDIPSPCWDSPPYFAQPDKVNQMMNWKDVPYEFSKEQLTWSDAWEIARPWVKDPRNPQPQRMYHNDKWAAGECDLVHRWDGRIRIIDVKMGDGSGKFASSLPDQLNFYSWLWDQTHESNCEGLEGWYLTNGLRKIVDLENKDSSYYKSVYDKMKKWPSDNQFPLAERCDGESGGCLWCSIDNVEYDKPNISMPYESLSSIPSRVNVKGVLQGSWGPLPNHYGEPVLGAMIQAGDKMVTIEESQPGSYPLMHSAENGEVIITGALPGVWRGQPRLYLDSKSQIVNESSLELTRMGMLRTKANVQGIIMSCSKRDGKRSDGRPWSMVSFHLWDGDRVAEVVAFGSSINGTMLSLKPGMEIGIYAAELGWREGLVQLRIDSRNTRIEIKTKS